MDAYTTWNLPQGLDSDFLSVLSKQLNPHSNHLVNPLLQQQLNPQSILQDASPPLTEDSASPSPPAPIGRGLARPPPAPTADNRNQSALSNDEMHKRKHHDSIDDDDDDEDDFEGQPQYKNHKDRTCLPTPIVPQSQRMKTYIVPLLLQSPARKPPSARAAVMSPVNSSARSRTVLPNALSENGKKNTSRTYVYSLADVHVGPQLLMPKLTNALHSSGFSSKIRSLHSRKRARVNCRRTRTCATSSAAFKMKTSC